MTTHDADRLGDILPVIHGAWKRIVTGIALLGMTVWVIALRLSAMPSVAPRVRSMAEPVVGVSQWIGIAYLSWWVVAVIAWVFHRLHHAAPTDPVALFQVRVPRPTGKAEAMHSAQAAVQSSREAGGMVEMLTSMIHLLDQGLTTRLSLELWGHPAEPTTLIYGCDPTHAADHLLRSVWAGAVPGSDVTARPDPRDHRDGVVAWAECQLAADASVPLRMLGERDGDPFGTLLGGLVLRDGVTHASVQLALAAAPPTWPATIRRTLGRLRQPVADPETKALIHAMEQKQRGPGVSVRLRIMTVAETEAAAVGQRQQLLTLLNAVAATRGTDTQRWTVARHGTGRGDALPTPVRVRWMGRPGLAFPVPWPVRTESVVVPDELALHWHLPTARYRHHVAWRANTYAPPPPVLLGTTITEGAA